MALDLYRHKRDFRRTPEPRGATVKKRGTTFVIHKHAARRLHYDLRLEYGGVLLSWAVPKGPSFDPGARRLAVKVEDHPLDYGSFEGNIPKGEYGAGAVIVWDRGRWIPEGDPGAGLRKGHLRFVLEGKKMAGAWSLVRMGKRAEAGKENWLLIKSRDKKANDSDIVSDEPLSVDSGKSIEEVRAGELKHSKRKNDEPQTREAPSRKLPRQRKAASSNKKANRRGADRRVAKSPVQKARLKSRRAADGKAAGRIVKKGPAPKHDQLAGLPLTHSERVLYPEQNITKGELARYYSEVAEWILPHLKDRALTLVRCPEGYQKECFYQRHANSTFDDSVGRVSVDEKGAARDYVTVDSLAGLIALVQAGVLELHTWGARNDRLELPDRVTFDLDPDPALPWSAVAQAARVLRTRLEDLGLTPFLKTTGGKGLHVVVPIARHPDWDETKGFAKALADTMAADEPDKYLAVMSKMKRRGKIFIDYLRNAWAATSVAAYSTRARPGAPVSAPLFWHELDSCRADTFTLKNMPARLAQLKKDPWAEYESARRPLTVSMRKKTAA